MTGSQEVGCRKCGKGSKWKIFSDGSYITKAECGHCAHIVEFDDDFSIMRSPDNQTISGRFL